MGTAFDRLQKLTSELYEKTKTDWTLHLSWIMTEPTCPFATLVPDHDVPFKMDGGGVWDDTPEKCIDKLCNVIENRMNETLFIEYAEKMKS